MSTATTIEWTRGDDGSAGATWNPVTGCTRVSAGCDHCYAATLARRLKAMGNPRYRADGPDGPGFGVTLHRDKLSEPLSWRRPRRVFVNSMSDLFHPEVPDEFIAAVFEVMARTPQHTYQVLTKRPGRMASFVVRWMHDACWPETGCPIFDSDFTPLPNVWLGTSVEDQHWATIRLAKLAQTPAVVRFASCEPLLGRLDLRRWLAGGLEWVIAGGESGPGHRPVDPAWVEALRDQCQAAGVPFFFKLLCTNAAIRCGARSIGGGSGPVDERWPHVSAQRVALGIGQPQPCNQAPGLHSGIENVRADGVEHQLRPPEQGEGARFIHGAPGQVDEPASGTALDVRPLDVDTGRGGDRAALQRPHRRWGVPRVQLQELVSPVASLDADVDVAVAGEVVAGAAGPARQVRGLDTDLHGAIIAAPGPIRELDPAAGRSVLRPERRSCARVVQATVQLGSRLARDLGAAGKGEDPEYWPEDLRIREYPATATARPA